MRNRQTGFTLIEIAIVLVIIGLLLGGVLKGQELITSARVRFLVSVESGVKAAFYGFQDRFRAYPGDYPLATTNITGATVNGNGNGRVEGAGACGAITGCVAYENIAAWDQVSHAGFINGTFAAAATADDTTTPKNPYGIYLDLQYDNAFGLGTITRHNLKTGGQIPVEIIAEVDRKIDDGSPYTGSFQFSTYQGNAAAAPAAPGATSCTDVAATTGVWQPTVGNTNCGGAGLF